MNLSRDQNLLALGGLARRWANVAVDNGKGLVGSILLCRRWTPFLPKHKPHSFPFHFTAQFSSSYTSDFPFLCFWRSLTATSWAVFHSLYMPIEFQGTSFLPSRYYDDMIVWFLCACVRACVCSYISKSFGFVIYLD